MPQIRRRLLELPGPEEYLDGDFSYVAAGFTRKDAAEARELLDKGELILPKDGEDTIDLLVDHAVQMITDVEGVDALEFLLAELEISSAAGDERFIEHFPELVIPMGEPAAAPLMAALLDPGRSGGVRISVIEVLGELAAEDVSRDSILQALATCLEGDAEERALKGFLIACVLDHEFEELVPAIRKAFAENLVDVSICGDMEEVEVDLGIRERRATPRRNWRELEEELAARSRLDRFGPIPLDADDETVLAHAMRLMRGPGGLKTTVELDGFLAAVVVSPYMVPPSGWLPRIWQDGDPEEQPTWPSMETAQRVMSALMTRYNHVLHGVADRSLAAPAEGDFHSWIEGFLDGTTIWDDGAEEYSPALGRLISFVIGLATAPAGEAETTVAEAFPRILKDAAKAYACRSEIAPPMGSAFRDDPVVLPFQREDPKVGRNDPCPCGSGKKYKNCCMN